MGQDRPEVKHCISRARIEHALVQVRIGCSGWFYWHWRGLFYPETKGTNGWFRHYTDHFRTVELNAPFYSWPKLATARSWRRQAPEGFRYSVKVNRLITHEKRLVHTRMLVEEFYRFAEILGPAMGCFLFQFPPSYRYTRSRLESLVRQLDPQFRNVVEFRHSSWWREAVYRDFAERGLIFCTVSAPRLPEDLIRTNETIYARLHGRSRWYRHDYSDDELEAWAGKICASGAREAWIYFDNDRDAFAIKNARSLIAKLRERGADVA
ncbi:MAG: DUF72 domain-containing protein [Verrucomicrobiota bacterium]|nr:DUF72 domain-containing protein [Verrucomicrobiota bacterium]